MDVGMEEIRQILSVIHAENEIILMMLSKLVYSYEDGKKVQNDLITQLDEMYEEAIRGKL